MEMKMKLVIVCLRSDRRSDLVWLHSARNERVSTPAQPREALASSPPPGSSSRLVFSSNRAGRLMDLQVAAE